MSNTAQFGRFWADAKLFFKTWMLSCVISSSKIGRLFLLSCSKVSNWIRANLFCPDLSVDRRLHWVFAVAVHCSIPDHGCLCPRYAFPAYFVCISINSGFFFLSLASPPFAILRIAVPADQLLVLDVREGWEPLCRFFGCPIPAAPFPHANRRNWIRFGSMLTIFLLLILFLSILTIIFWFLF